MVDAEELRVHMVGNAHIDPVWIWTWREGMHEVWSTFRSAVERLAEYPQACFTASSAAYYAWLEVEDPALFATIQALVAAGRWAIVGGMWVEPDCNLPSGESFCRQTLYAQRFFQRAFGRPARVGYNIDSFGHNIGLPQILAQSGLPYYVMMRPGRHEKSLPDPVFRWQGPDGAEVLTFRIAEGYACAGGDQTPLLGRIAAARDLAARSGLPVMVFYGVGNHGGGPTRATLEAIAKARASDQHLVFSTPEDYFGDLDHLDRRRLPVVRDDLQHHARGCYAVTDFVKAANHHAEIALGQSEQLDTVAHALWGTRAHPGDLTEAWKAVLFNQFHDILAGTSSEPAYVSVRHGYGFAESIADRVHFQALAALARRVDTENPPGGEGDGGQEEEPSLPVLLYNPLAWPVRQAVVIDRPAQAVTDADGRSVPIQALASGESTRFAAHTLVGAELPAMGYQVYWLKPQPNARPPQSRPWDGEALANDSFRVGIDAVSGAVESIWDVGRGREWLAAGGCRPVVLEDPSDTWSHDVSDYGEAEETCRFWGAEWVESGPVRTTLSLRYAWGQSGITLDWSLYEAMPWIEVRGRVDWHEGRSLLKLRLPWNLSGAVKTYAGAAYSVIRRQPTGEEEPVQQWVACETEAGGGVACTTGDRYSYDVRDKVLRVTILRSPWVADHGRGWARGNAEFGYTDQGAHAFTLRIHPYAGTWSGADLPRRAQEQDVPASLLIDTRHPGGLPTRESFCAVTGDGVMVSAVKRAENGKGMILRLWESRGEETECRVAGALLGPRVLVRRLHRHALWTVLVPDDPGQPATTVDITEWRDGELGC